MSPANPTITNVVSFIAPIDGAVYANSCFASVARGDPAIALDVSNHTITVSFSAPRTNMPCPLVVLPVSGVEGELGLLEEGKWGFRILQNSFQFDVAEAPLELSARTLTNAVSLELGWPVSGDTFGLESSDFLASGNWQMVTNAPTITSNHYEVQIHIGASNRFFRLRRLPP